MRCFMKCLKGWSESGIQLFRAERTESTEACSMNVLCVFWEEQGGQVAGAELVGEKQRREGRQSGKGGGSQTAGLCKSFKDFGYYSG